MFAKSVILLAIKHGSYEIYCNNILRAYRGRTSFRDPECQKNIEANSPEEAIGIAYNLFKAEAPDECYIVSIIPNPAS